MPTPRQRAKVKALERLRAAMEYLYACENALDEAADLLVKREPFLTGQLFGLSVIVDDVRHQIESACEELDADEGKGK